MKAARIAAVVTVLLAIAVFQAVGQATVVGEEIKPLLGTWVFPFGLKVPNIWAKEAWNEDGTGAIYDSWEDTAPMARFTFEVKKKDPQQSLYQVVVSYPAAVFCFLIGVGPDGSFKESQSYGNGVSAFPSKFTPGTETYSVQYRRPASEPTNEELVGTWVDQRGAFNRVLLGKVVFNSDYTGTVYDKVTDIVPMDRFRYEIVWKDPRSPTYLVIFTYRPDNFWYSLVKIGKQGKLMETDSFGLCVQAFPAEINAFSQNRFSGEKR